MSRVLITIAQYAKKTGVKRDAVYKRISRGQLPKNVRVEKIAGHHLISIPKKLIKEKELV